MLRDTPQVLQTIGRRRVPFGSGITMAGAMTSPITAPRLESAGRGFEFLNRLQA